MCYLRLSEAVATAIAPLTGQVAAVVVPEVGVETALQHDTITMSFCVFLRVMQHNRKGSCLASHCSDKHLSQ